MTIFVYSIIYLLAYPIPLYIDVGILSEPHSHSPMM